jgi:membrane protease YdiL (CAAX protease family)
MGLPIGLLVITRRPWVALTISSVFFGAVHLLDDDATTLGAVGGVMYGLALLRTARLWMPITMHFAWNFVQGTVLGSWSAANTASACPSSPSIRWSADCSTCATTGLRR